MRVVCPGGCDASLYTAVNVAPTGGSCIGAVVCGVGWCILTATADKRWSWLPPAGSWRVTGLWCPTRNGRAAYGSLLVGGGDE
jgi:hypothetical protein